MSRSAASPASGGRPRKSPLRLATAVEPSFPTHQPNGPVSPGQLRTMMISEFEQWLRSRTSQEDRPFHEETVLAYAKAARALDAWMAKEKIDGDFTACDTAILNNFFRDYHAAHTRGGTNTRSPGGTGRCGAALLGGAIRLRRAVTATWAAGVISRRCAPVPRRSRPG